MASTYFFNGQLYTSPGVMSAVDDSAMVSTQPTTGNVLALIGQCTGGQPGVPLVFGDPSTALATLGSGELCQAVVKAFSASSDTNSPQEVVAIRVGAATQASLSLSDSTSNPALVVTSTQWGLFGNASSIAIAAGTTSGQHVTITNGSQTYSADNIGRNAFSVLYTGVAASAVMSVTNSSVTLQAPTGTTIATLPLATYPTVGALVAAINAVPGFSATVLDGKNGATPSLNGLDNVSSQSVKATYTATANLQAVIDWINSIRGGLMTAARATNAGLPPANIAATLLAGGSAPAPLTGDWTNALTALQSVDVQWIAPLTSDPGIQAAVDAHVHFMSTSGRKERRAWVGGALGLTVAAVLPLSYAINSDRTAMAWPGHYDYDVASGAYTLWAPYMTAAKIAAGFAGMNPGSTMTAKALSIAGLEVQVKNPVDTDQLIQGGITPVHATKSGYEVTRAVSTWLQNNNFDKVEVSCGAAVDFVQRNVRTALKPLVGGGVSPLSLARAVTLTDSMLRTLAVPQPQGPGVIVGDANSPAYKSILAQASGDAILVSYQCSPVIPCNFVPVTASIVPYTGSASSGTASSLSLSNTN